MDINLPRPPGELGEFASAISPELRAQVRAAAAGAASGAAPHARALGAARLARFWRSRATTNRYFWRERFELREGLDGAPQVWKIFKDGSESQLPDASPAELVVRLNAAMVELERAGFRDGVLHNALGAMSNIGSYLRIIELKGLDWRGAGGACPSPLEGIAANLRAPIEALEQESAALRARSWLDSDPDAALMRAELPAEASDIQGSVPNE